MTTDGIGMGQIVGQYYIPTLQKNVGLTVCWDILGYFGVGVPLISGLYP